VGIDDIVFVIWPLCLWIERKVIENRLAMITDSMSYHT